MSTTELLALVTVIEALIAACFVGWAVIAWTR